MCRIRQSMNWVQIFERSLEMMTVLVFFFSPLSYASQRWYRTNDAGQTVSLGNDNSKYLLSANRRVITILRPTVADAGLYRCESTYHRPSTSPNQDVKVSAEARLTVLGEWVVILYYRYGRLV